MSRSITRHQQLQEELAGELVMGLTELDDSDPNFERAMQFTISNFRYHRFLSPNSHETDREISGLCLKFNVQGQTVKASSLSQLTKEFLSRELLGEPSKSSLHYSMLALLLHLSESASHTPYTPHDWRIDDPTEQAKPVDWWTLLVGDEDFASLSGDDSDLEPWPLSDEGEDASRQRGRASSMGMPASEEVVIDNETTKRHTALPCEPYLSLGLGQYEFLSSQLVPKYWLQNLRCWPSVRCLPGQWRGEDVQLGALWSSYNHDRSLLGAPSPHVVVAEKWLVRETLWLLSGSDKLFVYSLDEGGRISPAEHVQMPHLSPASLKRLLAHFAVIGSKLHTLRRFVEQTLCFNSIPAQVSGVDSVALVGKAVDGHDGGGGLSSGVNSRQSRTVQAFAAAVSEQLQVLGQTFGKLEEEALGEENCQTLLQLKIAVRSLEPIINLLYKLLEEGVVKHPSSWQVAAHLLSTVEKMLSDLELQGPNFHERVKALLSVQLSTLRPYMDMLELWMAEGAVVDGCGEFCFQRNSAVSGDSPRYWCDGVQVCQADSSGQAVVISDLFAAILQEALRAGKSMQLIQSLGKLPDYLSRHSSKTGDGAGSSCNRALYNDFLTSLGKCLSGRGEDLSSVGSFDMDRDVESAPTDTSTPTMSDQPDIGLSFHVPNAAAGSSLLQRNFSRLLLSDRHHYFLYGDRTDSPGQPSFAMNNQLRTFTLRVADILADLSPAHPPLSLAMRHCLQPLVVSRSTEVCKALLDYIRDDHQLVDHLSILWQYFLMEAGEVMHHFCDTIFQKMQFGEEWQLVNELNVLFQEALHLRDQELAVRLLAVDLDSASRQRGKSTTPQQKSSLVGLDRLCLVYKASWPINIIIEANSLNTLNQVFQFLLHLKYAKWSVDRTGWKGLGFPSCSVSKLSPVQRLALLLRSRLLHFINALHTYIMTRILHSVGLEFRQAVEEALNLDDVISATHEFVDLVHNRCLLNEEASYVHEAIMKLLRLAVNFRQLCDSGLPTSAFGAMKNMLEEFSRCNRFLVSVLLGIVQRGAFPHLEALAYSLDASYLS